MPGDVFQQIGNTLWQEFSDLPDAAKVSRVTLRMLLAAILGGVIGFERESKGKAAGLRTHMLVALGAALFILGPQQAGVTNDELMRVLQGLVAGVGFLGAGTILKHAGEEEVTGLTTAASIWLTAAIGVTVGMGHQATAVVSTLLALAILSSAGKIAGRFERDKES